MMVTLNEHPHLLFSQISLLCLTVGIFALLLSVTISAKQGGLHRKEQSVTMIRSSLDHFYYVLLLYAVFCKADATGRIQTKRRQPDFLQFFNSFVQPRSSTELS